MDAVVLDTDILSEVTKAKHQGVVDAARLYLAEHRHLTFTVVSLMEVVAGYSRQRREEKLGRFLALCARSNVLPLDAIGAEMAGRIDSDLLRAGQAIGIADVMIASIAIRHGLPLVTGNTADYARIQAAGYPLALGNWRDGSP